MSWIGRGMQMAALVALVASACTKEERSERSERSEPRRQAKTAEPAGASRTPRPLPPPMRPPTRKIAATHTTAARAHIGKLEVLYTAPRAPGGRLDFRAPGGMPARFCFDGKRLFWSTGTSIGGISHAWSHPLNGPVSLLATDKGLGFVMSCHQGKVYGNRGFEVIEYVGQQGTRAITTGKENPLHVVFDGAYLYFNSYKTSDIWRAPLAGGKVQRFARSRYPTQLLSDGGMIYWTDYKEGTINRVDTKTGVKKVLARKQKRPIALASDKTHLYWGEEKPGTINKMAKSGGAITELVRGAVNHDEIAVHKGYVYWRSWSWLQSGQSGPRPQRHHHVSRIPVSGGRSQVVISDMHMPEDLQITHNRLLVINKGEGTLLSLVLP